MRARQISSFAMAFNGQCMFIHNQIPDIGKPAGINRQHHHPERGYFLCTRDEYQVYNNNTPKVSTTRPNCCSRCSVAKVTPSEASPTILKTRVAFATFLSTAAASVSYPSFYLIQTNTWEGLSVLSGMLPLDYGTLLPVCNLVQVVNREDGSK